ncbi:hypothetical protein CYLTODRAFT_418933 [Cylindrobasidium torrendii FP15055 ss-10]|uniref:Uncharacterized protein n=1 Tax=Cylindrobasidium torrendii FP15055 ss-10 TaxID=1314674 RepID=A0A0D7BP79_9AGAR|nr:hypothetical protein CYLTODRAFT_418933 [Cylindrobasidium torrendii FP15055 ss-10]
MPSGINLKSILLFGILGSFSVYFLYHNPALLLSKTTSKKTTPHSVMSWKSRASTHPEPSTFEPSLASLTLLAVRDTPVAQNVPTLSVYNDRTAITASGDVLVLSQEDYDQIVALAGSVHALPETGEFRNTWRVSHAMTSKPIDHVFLATDNGLKEVGVYGYDKEKKELKKPVGDITHLPGEISEIMEVVLEGRVGYDKAQEKTEIVEKVKAIIPA